VSAAAQDQPEALLRPLAGPAELKACEALQKRAWNFSDLDVISTPQLAAAQKVGGLVLGAFDPSSRLIGFCYGFLGRYWDRLLHYSQMLAVEPEHRGRGLGLRLKRYQRERALAQGLDCMAWTFDPLEARNAGLNLRRLGAIGVGYVVDFYGATTSSLHAGTATDRVMVRWDLGSARTLERLQDRGGDFPPVPSVLAPQAGGAWPRPSAPELNRGAPALQLEIPDRFQELKRADLELARDWRAATRAVFLHYLGRGYRAIDFVRREGAGIYRLERTEDSSPNS
jgi:predicted GNAT superfamily acetyltransferase